jgi:hypothetical protein
MKLLLHITNAHAKQALLDQNVNIFLVQMVLRPNARMVDCVLLILRQLHIINVFVQLDIPVSIVKYHHANYLMVFHLFV